MSAPDPCHDHVPNIPVHALDNPFSKSSKFTVSIVSCAPTALLTFSPSLNIPDNDLSSTSPASYSDVYHQIIAPALGSCPTKHYIVVLQPSVTSADYEHESTQPFLSALATSNHGMKISQVRGQVNDNWTINTILMDCLHHGVTRVEEIDVRIGENAEQWWSLGDDKDLIDKSVMFVRLPAVTNPGRGADVLIEGMVQRWFGNKDYTLFWITEARTEEIEREDQSVGEIGESEGEGQKPLIGE